MDEFRRRVLKVDKPRNHKIKNSFGVRDIYYWLSKNKWDKCPVTLKEFRRIVRLINQGLADRLVTGYIIKIPYSLGSIEVVKRNRKARIINNKIVNYKPVDWDRTLTLWQEDEESYKNKTLIRLEEKEVFEVLYHNRIAHYKNKGAVRFNVNRGIKLKLKEKIKDGILDAFLI